VEMGAVSLGIGMGMHVKSCGDGIGTQVSPVHLSS